MTIRLNRWFVLLLGASVIALLLLLSPWQAYVSASTGANPTPCPPIPAEPRVTRAAMERFEHGYMAWIQDTGKIYVLYDGPALFSGQAETFDDTWKDGMPDRDPSLVPPQGKQQPIRGFGWIWRNNQQVRDRLGWAADGQTGYTVLIEERGDKIWLNGSGYDVFTIFGGQWQSVDLWRQ